MRSSTLARPTLFAFVAAAAIASGCSSAPAAPAPETSDDSHTASFTRPPINGPGPGPLCLAPPPLKPPNMSMAPQFRQYCASRVQGYELVVAPGYACPIIDLPSYGGIWWPTNFYASDPNYQDSPYPWAQVCSYAFKNVMSYGWAWLDVAVDPGVFCGTVSYSQMVYILPAYTSEGPGPLSSVLGSDDSFQGYCLERHGGCDTCLQ